MNRADLIVRVARIVIAAVRFVAPDALKPGPIVTPIGDEPKRAAKP